MKSACLVFVLALTLVATTGPPVTAQTTAAAAVVAPASGTMVSFWQAVWSYFFGEATTSDGSGVPCPDCQSPPPPPTCDPYEVDCKAPIVAPPDT